MSRAERNDTNFVIIYVKLMRIDVTDICNDRGDFHLISPQFESRQCPDYLKHESFDIDTGSRFIVKHANCVGSSNAQISDKR